MAEVFNENSLALNNLPYRPIASAAHPRMIRVGLAALPCVAMIIESARRQGYGR